MADMTEAQRRDRTRDIIRAAAYLECAGILDQCGIKYAQQGRIGLKVTKAIQFEADRIRDRAVEIKRKSDEAVTSAAKAGD